MICNHKDCESRVCLYCAVLLLCWNPVAQVLMHQTKYLWGILVVLLTLLLSSPRTADARSPDIGIDTKSIERIQSLRQAKSYPFDEVWALIQKHQRAHKSHFTPELVACLMWEESGYRLVENDQSRALGFGQVMPATLAAINKRFKTKFTRNDMLTSPDKSVEATILALELAYSWKRNKVAALVAYAGGFQNYRTIAKWITAEPRMIQARAAGVQSANQVSSHAKPAIVDALHLCSQPGFHPQTIFD